MPDWVNPAVSTQQSCIAVVRVPDTCTLLDVEVAEPYCAAYVTAAIDLQLRITVRLPGAPALPSPESTIWLKLEAEVFYIKSKQKNQAKHGKVSARVPEHRNRTSSTPVQLNLVARLTGTSVSEFSCEFVLPASLSTNIGAVNIWFDHVSWDRATLQGPADNTAINADEVECVHSDKKARGTEQSNAPRLFSESLTQTTRLILLRLVGVPNPILLPWEPGIARFTEFVTFKHLFHACLWANNTPPSEIYEPGGLIYQIVQNVRRYDEGWIDGFVPEINGTEKEPAISYPHDDLTSPTYDVRNDGWNVLDNPDGGRQAAQCNQLGSLYVDVLGALGFPNGEVLELERLYTVHGGTTVLRHMMAGFSLHGVLHVILKNQNWCYDTTMSAPPERWFGTLADAKDHFGKFTHDQWRYMTYRGQPVSEAMQADEAWKPLAIHLPATSLGNSLVPGAWGTRLGQIPYKAGVNHARAPEPGRDEPAMDLLMASLRISVSCDGENQEGRSWDNGMLQYVIPKNNGVVRVTADKPYAVAGTTDATTWEVDGIAAPAGVTLELVRTATRRFAIVARLAGEEQRIVIWIAWASISILMTGSLPNDCPASVSFSQALIKDMPRQLGVLADKKLAIGRVAAVCTLEPPGIESIVKKGWKIRRMIDDEWTWTDYGYETRQNRNDQGAKGTGMFNAQPTRERKLYLCDAPNVAIFGAAREWVKTCMHFRQWMELDGLRYSDDARWTFAGHWCIGQITWAQLGENFPDDWCDAQQQNRNNANHPF